MFWNLVFILRVFMGWWFFAFSFTIFGVFLAVYGPGGMGWLLDIPRIIYGIIIVQALMIWGLLLEVSFIGPRLREKKRQGLHLPDLASERK